MPAKKKKTKSSDSKLKQVLSHDLFFWGVVALFIFNALWIALSAVYPMLFDEEFHLGVIEVYSHQLGPFITAQAPETVFHGDLTRMNSYLFHYLMSFPYRLVSLFTSDIIAHVITLRLINIAFVATSLWLFRKTLLLGGFSRALSHLAILFFVLIPLVPFTAAQINYDNLIMIFTAGIFFSALKSLKKSPQQISWLTAMLSIGLLGSIVKFTFLPIFVASAAFVAFELWRQNGKKLPANLKQQLQALSKPAIILLAILSLVSAGLFVERYGVNLVQYRSLEPKCERVHSEQLCSQYNIWQRNTDFKRQYQKEQWPLWRPLQYTYNRWVPHIFRDLFVTGAYTGGDIALRKPLGQLETAMSMKLVRLVGWAVFWLSIILTIIYWRKLKLKDARYLFLAATSLYAAALWIKNYTDYLAYGIPVATQGRYFIPLLIPLLAMAGYAFSVAIRRQVAKTVLLAVALLLFTQGAGATAYILYSNDKWYWPNNQTVQEANHGAKKVINLFIFKP